MTTPLITGASEWRGVDGFSELVISRALDGRIHITVNDTDRPGFTASFGSDAQAAIAAFIKGDK
ncbi:hypothetical protein ACWCW7_34480 [Nocardia tengchongensis]